MSRFSKAFALAPTPRRRALSTPGTGARTIHTAAPPPRPVDEDGWSDHRHRHPRSRHAAEEAPRRRSSSCRKTR